MFTVGRAWIVAATVSCGPAIGCSNDTHGAGTAGNGGSSGDAGVDGSTSGGTGGVGAGGSTSTSGAGGIAIGGASGAGNAGAGNAGTGNSGAAGASGGGGGGAAGGGGAVGGTSAAGSGGAGNASGNGGSGNSGGSGGSGTLAPFAVLDCPVYVNCFAYYVSADGTYVTGIGDTHALRWTDTTSVELGALSGWNSETPTDISYDGSVIVGFAPTATGSAAFRWDAGTLVELPPLPGGSTYTATALAVSGDGRVVVGTSTATTATRAPVTWIDGNVQNLPELAGTTGNGPYEVDGTGSVFAGQGQGSTYPVALRWTSTGVESLGITSARAWGVSADGKYLVGAYTPDPTTSTLRRAFRWSVASGLEEIPPPDSTFDCQPVGNNGDASILPIVCADTAGKSHYYLWSQATGSVSFETILSRLGVNVTYSYMGINAISINGNVIIGDANNGINTNVGWRAVITSVFP